IRDFHVTGVQTCALPISTLDSAQAGLSSENASQAAARNRRGVTRISRSANSPLAYASAPLRSAIVQRIEPSGDWAISSPRMIIRSEERRVGKEWRSQGSV